MKDLIKDINFTEMLVMQKELWEKYKDSWSPLEPVYGRNSILWMMGELGEVIQIIKKRGEEDIMNNNKIRAAFVEEMADVLMYYNDILLRYNVTPDEIANAYKAKHTKNMKRDFKAECENYIISS